MVLNRFNVYRNHDDFDLFVLHRFAYSGNLLFLSGAEKSCLALKCFLVRRCVFTSALFSTEFLHNIFSKFKRIVRGWFNKVKRALLKKTKSVRGHRKLSTDVTLTILIGTTVKRLYCCNNFNLYIFHLMFD